MRVLLILLVCVFSIQGMGVESVQMEYEEDSPYTLEPSFILSSLNQGSRFLGVALTARLESWLRVGVEGELPMDFDRDTQIYTGRLFVRVPMIDRVNKVFIQNAISFSLFNTSTEIGQYASPTFFNASVQLGYARKLSEKWSLGAMAGAQYSTIDNYVYSEINPSMLFTRASVMGSFVF